MSDVQAWAALISFVLWIIYDVYAMSSLILLVMKGARVDRDSRPYRILNLVWKWSKYPALGYVIAGPALWVISRGHLSPADYITAVLNGWIWWMYRNEGDDDWKKKLKSRVTEAVEVFRGRLVVVAQGT